VRDYAQVKADNKITQDIADKALSMLDIDEHGLDEMDKRILETILHKFAGGPVGVNSLAVSVGEEPAPLKRSTSPTLYRKGTSSGRLRGVWPRSCATSVSG
jgi:Holliday junction DNA helicase RuvB